MRGYSSVIACFCRLHEASRFIPQHLWGEKGEEEDSDWLGMST